jgi:REP element-mobilizing transposase RayT
MPDPMRELECAARMTEDACRLTVSQREIVHRQVAETCDHKRWQLHGVNCRTNHVHVVLSSTAPPKTIREQLKAWCTRRLNEHQAAVGIVPQLRRTNWWSERGSIRWVFHDDDLAAAIDYVLNQQDNPSRFSGSPKR